MPAVDLKQPRLKYGEPQVRMRRLLLQITYVCALRPT